jgi:Choline dehydrogenase and related flavoproteins
MNSWHDQCQLKTGKESEGGVVDSLGGVYGVKNLIVADASVIPYHTDGNTSAPAYLIAETIAESLLSE